MVTKAIRPAIFKWRHTEPELILCAVRWYLLYRLRVLGQWFDGIRFYAAASNPRRARRTWAGLR